MTTYNKKEGASLKVGLPPFCHKNLSGVIK